MNTDLKVTYDTTLKLMQISPSAWQALGPMQWFPNYRIIAASSSYFAHDPRVINISKYYRGIDRPPQKISSILFSQSFQELIQGEELEQHKLILARPMISPLGERTLCNDIDVAKQFENKVWLRRHFNNQLNFPPFLLVAARSLIGDTFSRLAEQLEAEALIIQDAKLSGGRGTYSIKNTTEFAVFISLLGDTMKNERSDDLFVVSKQLPHFKERTLQICITESAVWIGPVQAQLVGHPQLVSDQPDAIQFCGGRIVPGLVSDEQNQTMHRAAEIVGEELQRLGYRGILGMDFLISDNEVYPIEVNPRLTGLSLLLAFLQKEVPYLLLHILELANSAYEISISPEVADQGISGSFIQVYAQTDGVCTLQSGVYDRDGVRLAQACPDGGIMPSDAGQYFVAMRVDPGQQVSQGKSLAFIYSKEQLFDDEMNLNPAVSNLIRRIRE